MSTERDISEAVASGEKNETEQGMQDTQEILKAPGDGHKIRRLLKLAAKLVVFVLLLTLIVYGLNQTLVPRYVYSNATDPMSSVFSGLYEMEENSVDVIFLGSSHTGSGLNPQDMYDEAGIRSYNLASSGQSILLSYYWLKEALNYQSPKVGKRSIKPRAANDIKILQP